MGHPLILQICLESPLLWQRSFLPHSQNKAETDLWIGTRATLLTIFNLCVKGENTNGKEEGKVYLADHLSVLLLAEHHP